MGETGIWRAQHTATLLLDGRVLVVGGLEEGDRTEIFDPATGTWAKGKKLNESRYAHSTLLLRDGTVLLMGGQTVDSCGDRSLTNSTEIVTP